MKRFHIHIAVDNLAASIDFYTKLFGLGPSKQQPDYAKWMLDDPRVNFAISAQANRTGIDHLGIQVDSAEELMGIRLLADAASTGQTRDQGKTTCCYANSEKHWTIDPQGIAWEHFMTYSDADMSGEETSLQSKACCIPLHATENTASDETGACCIAKDSKQEQSICC